MSDEKPNRPAEPSKVSWTVAVFCSVFVLSVLYLGEMISRGYYFARLRSGFETSFTSTTDLTFAVDNPEFAELFEHEQKQIKLLRPLISLLAQNDAVKAAAYWKRQNPPRSTLHTRLAKMVGDLETLAGEKESHKTELEKVASLESAKSEQYVQLKSELRLYLGVESKGRPEVAVQPEAESSKESSICTFYREGLLASLPVLASLPDNVTDFKDLGRYFTLAKAGLPPPSVETAAKGLADLRARGVGLQGECDSLKLKTADILTQQNTNADAQTKLFADAQMVIRKILFALAEPEVDAQTVLAYDLFRASVGKWGYQLPELRSVQS